MKQPALGKKIAQIRKQKNLTQEELVERCNVSVRTIQRIEAGEVTPRSSTIKIIIAALEADIEEVMQEDQPGRQVNKIFLTGDETGDSKEISAILQTAWIAGIIYLVLGLIDAGMDFIHLSGKMDLSQSIFFATTKGAVFISYALFLRGFVLLGRLFDQYLLKIACFMMAAAFLVITAIDIYDVFRPFGEEMYLYVQAGASITVGGIGIVLGLAFWKLQDSMGRMAAVAGGFELVIGVFFLTVFLFFISLVLLVPATIIEIVLLYKAYELMERENSAAILNP